MDTDDATQHRLTEPVPIDDDLCTELSLVEDLDFGARLVWSEEQTVYESGQQAMVVRAKIVLPYSRISPVVETLLRFMAQRTGKLHRVK